MYGPNIMSCYNVCIRLNFRKKTVRFPPKIIGVITTYIKKIIVIFFVIYRRGSKALYNIIFCFMKMAVVAKRGFCEEI